MICHKNNGQSPYLVVRYPLDFQAVPLPYGLLPFGFLVSPPTLWFVTVWILGSPPTLWFVTVWIYGQSLYLMVCYCLDF